MKIIDISQTLEEPMVLYPSLPKFEKQFVRHYSTGDNVCVSKIIMASHNGTHIDAPYHYCESGKKIDEIDLELFYGIATIIEVPNNKQKIDVDFLKKYKDFRKRILFKTSNSKIRFLDKEFREDYVYLTGEAADYLVKKGVKLIGIDYVSIDGRKEASKPAHRTLLGNGVLILEGINLNKVAEGQYLLSCLPIKIRNIEASPCRAVLICE